MRSIRVLAPIVKSHGIKYARDSFEARLNRGDFSIARTKVPKACRAPEPPQLTPSGGRR
jgi:hypothetical protein